MIARRARKELDVVIAESQSDAWTGKLPYGVEGEIAASLDVNKELRTVWDQTQDLGIANDKPTNALIHQEPSL